MNHTNTTKIMSVNYTSIKKKLYITYNISCIYKNKNKNKNKNKFISEQKNK